MKARMLVVLAVIFCISGIALADPTETLQKLTEGYQLPAQPTEGQGMIYVIRPSNDLGYQSVSIYHDDGNGEAFKGRILGRDYIFFEVAPGKHCIASDNLNANKRGICFQVKNNETIFLKQAMTSDKSGDVEYMDIIDPALGKFYLSKAIPSKKQ